MNLILNKLMRTTISNPILARTKILKRIPILRRTHDIVSVWEWCVVPGGDADHEDGDDGVQHRGGHRGVGGAVQEGQEPAHLKKYTYRWQPTSM